MAHVIININILILLPVHRTQRTGPPSDDEFAKGFAEILGCQSDQRQLADEFLGAHALGQGVQGHAAHMHRGFPFFG